MVANGTLRHSLHCSGDGRYWPRLCENSENASAMRIVFLVAIKNGRP